MVNTDKIQLVKVRYTGSANIFIAGKDERFVFNQENNYIQVMTQKEYDELGKDAKKYGLTIEKEQ